MKARTYMNSALYTLTCHMLVTCHANYMLIEYVFIHYQVIVNQQETCIAYVYLIASLIMAGDRQPAGDDHRQHSRQAARAGLFTSQPQP